MRQTEKNRKNPRNGNSKARDPRYDCLRAVSVMAIIMVHAMPVETVSARQWWFNSIMTPFLLSFVGIYFMLSGMFLLEHGTERIGEFYRKRFITVGIPFLVYGFIYYCYNVHADGVVLPVWKHAGRYLAQVLTAGLPRAGHMWFMYAIVSFYICAPFLSRMVKNMTDREMKVFLLLMLGIHVVEVAGEILGLDVKPWAQFVLYTGWVYYFLLGYGLKRLCRKEQFPIFAVLAVFGLAMDVAADIGLSWWVPQNPHKSPAMVFICAGVFLLFEYYGGKVPVWAGKLGIFVSRYSFSIYLIHFLILSYYVNPVLLKDMAARHYILGTMVSTIVTFCLSLACSMVTDYLAVRPIERLAERIRFCPRR